MKKFVALTLVLLFAISIFTSCVKEGSFDDKRPPMGMHGEVGGLGDFSGGSLEDDNTSFGKPFEELGFYGGYFEGETKDISVKRVSGTDGAYRIAGNTLIFSGISEESVYSVSGSFSGNIVIDVSEEYKFDLELNGFSLVSYEESPIKVLSGDEVGIKAKKDSMNYIYDLRDEIDDSDVTSTKGIIHSEVDLEIGGKGALYLMSENNNGIHTKDDLEIKNLSLFVAASDNALKGNDSVEIESGKLTLIATRGDGIKTENSDISEKGNQRGTVSILGADVSLFSACDGIDAAYNVIIENDSATVNIYTDKYSNYSKEVSTVCSRSDYFLNTSIDHYSSENSFTSCLTTDNRRPGGDGGFGGATEGNTEKGSYSTKGIKAANEIRISHGRINIKSYDDALHANTDTAIENGSLPLGRVYIGGGNITVYTNDDGVHADGEAIFEGGSLIITHCYEGIEGKNIKISSCTLDITATDDGINSSATSGRGVEISSGSIKIVCYGDGIDTNSATSYEGIVITGGEIFIFTGSRVDSTLDTENGYTFEGGTLFSVMQRGAMFEEAKHCENFSDIGYNAGFNLEEGKTLFAQIGEKSYSFDIPFTLQGVIIILGDKAPSISVK